jgi:hypothetical protein
MLVVLLFTALFTIAQSKADEEHENFFRIGAKAGVNINKISG